MLLALLGLLAAAASPAEAAPRVSARRVVGGLDQPVAFTFDPGGRIWFVEKTTGRIRIFDPASGRTSTFSRVRGVNGEGERGLLGIALDPGYPDRPFVYVYATRSVRGTLRNQILRLRDAKGTGRHPCVRLAVPASSSPYHNGGRILFGPDGRLYAVVGDGHDASNAQDRTSEDRGKILRLEPNGDVPAANPRAGEAFFAYGIRNSFGMAFDPQTGRLWETDNGPECNDELNLIRRGGNYGWGPHETCGGTAPRNTNQDGRHPILPRWFTETTIGITGIAFCDRCDLGKQSEGRAFFGSVNTGQITRVTLNTKRTGVAARSTMYTHDAGVLSIEVGPDGRLYFSDPGGIYRLLRA